MVIFLNSGRILFSDTTSSDVINAGKSTPGIPDFYPDEIIPSDTNQQINNDSVLQPWSELQLSDSNNLRDLVLKNPTFLVKNVTPETDIDKIHEESQTAGSCSYLGIGINPQQQGEGNAQNDLEQDKDLSSTGISSIDNYICISSSEDEFVNCSYSINQKPVTAKMTRTGKKLPDTGSRKTSLNKRKNNVKERNPSERNVAFREGQILSISSEDSDCGEPRKTGSDFNEITKRRNPASLPICRIESYYSLSFKGDEWCDRIHENSTHSSW